MRLNVLRLQVVIFAPPKMLLGDYILIMQYNLLALDFCLLFCESFIITFCLWNGSFVHGKRKIGLVGRSKDFFSKIDSGSNFEMEFQTASELKKKKKTLVPDKVKTLILGFCLLESTFSYFSYCWDLFYLFCLLICKSPMSLFCLFPCLLACLLTVGQNQTLVSNHGLMERARDREREREKERKIY